MPGESISGRTGLSLDMQNISVIADRSCCARVYSASYNMATGVFARVDLVYPVLASHESYKKKGGQRYRHFHHASQTPGRTKKRMRKGPSWRERQENPFIISQRSHGDRAAKAPTVFLK